MSFKIGNREIRVIQDYDDYNDQIDIEKFDIKNEKINFVGIIVQESEIIVSFPKNYYNKLSDLNHSGLLYHIRLILTSIKKYYKSISMFSGENESDSFPFEAYLNICNYFKMYGLYNEEEIMYKKGYNGKVDWKRTFLKSSKIINKGNLLFMPFELKKRREFDVFITECMDYILDDGYISFGNLFDYGVPYKSRSNKLVKKNVQKIIYQLKSIRSSHFKDSVLNLIDSMITYLQWKSKGNKTVKYLTYDFHNIWENSIMNFLNSNKIELDEINLKLIITKNMQKNNFHKESFNIESDIIRTTTETRKFMIVVDHIEKRENACVVLDSKYMSSVKKMDYKQFSYNYIIKRIENYSDLPIYNGLILPCSTENHTVIHLDRQDIDGHILYEYYLNSHNVLLNYTKS